MAVETAELWRNGLAGWEIFRERIQALKDGPQFAVYTPGSDAGLPVNILCWGRVDLAGELASRAVSGDRGDWSRRPIAPAPER